MTPSKLFAAQVPSDKVGRGWLRSPRRGIEVIHVAGIIPRPLLFHQEELPELARRGWCRQLRLRDIDQPLLRDRHVVVRGLGSYSSREFRHTNCRWCHTRWPVAPATAEHEAHNSRSGPVSHRFIEG